MMNIPPTISAPQEAPIIIFQWVLLFFSRIDIVIKETRPSKAKSKPIVFISIRFYTFLVKTLKLTLEFFVKISISNENLSTNINSKTILDSYDIFFRRFIG